MKVQTVLPDDGFEPRSIVLRDDLPPFMVYCKPKPLPGVRWGHRVMVKCTCGRDIPFGRMCQHYPMMHERK
jgi:hypothetical protein